MGRWITTGLVAIAVVGLAACGDGGGGGGGSGDGDEGAGTTVTLLTHDSFALPARLLDEFTAGTGITVRVVKQGDAGSLVNQAVLARDNPIGDVLYGVDNAFLSRAVDGEIFDAYRADAAIDNAALGDLADPADGLVTPIDYGDVCVNYDTAWFADAGIDPPSTLGDLVAAEFEGLTVVENAASSSPGLAFLLATIDRFGDDGWQEYWEQLVANDALVVDGWEQAYNGQFTAGGGGGDRPIVVSYASSPPADVIFSDPKRDTTNVGVLTDGCFRQVEYAGVLAGTDEPDAARRVVDFLLSRPVQDEVPEAMFVFPARADAVLPEVFRAHAVLPDDPVVMDPARIAAHRDDWVDEWSEIAG